MSKCLPLKFPGMNGVFKLLIDSGSSVTVLSKHLFDSFPPENRPDLQTDCSDCRLESANGGKIKTYGKINITFVIGLMPVEHIVYVAEITDLGLLGEDFIEKHVSHIDVVNSALSVKGKWIPCVRSDSTNLVARVTVHEDRMIPAGHEVLVEADIHNWSDESNVAVVEPHNKFFGSTSLFMAKTLVNTEGPHVCLRVINTSQENLVLQGGVNIAHVHPVDCVLQQVDTEVDGIARSISQKTVTAGIIPQQEDIPQHLCQLYQDTVAGLTESQGDQLKSLFLEYADVFAKSPDDLGGTDIAQHEIDTGSAKPIKLPPRRVPLAFRGEETIEVEKIRRNRIIQKSNSPWAAPVVLVRKKDGTVRFCIDYRRLNSLTIRDAYPLPRIEECLDCLEGSLWFSTLDLQSGYFQLKVKEADRAKTVFVTKDGLFEFLVMPFGLCNVPSTFERAMELILRGLQWKHLLIYLDDVILFSKTFPEHLGRLWEVLKRFSENGLKIKPSKCQLLKGRVAFLGHIVSKDGISTDPAKVTKVSSWPQPQSATEVRAFLGLCSYYRKYVRSFATVAAPLVTRCLYTPLHYRRRGAGFVGSVTHGVH